MKLDEGYYEIEKVLEKRFNQNHEEEFLVKFRGYSHSDNNRMLDHHSLVAMHTAEIL